MFLANNKLELPAQGEALPGRAETMEVPEAHFVNANPLTPPFPEGMQTALFGLGCFWGAEKVFWQLDGVFTTAVGYAPVQPIPYSHRLHVGELGLDCRYCHTSVETTPKANIPPTQTCMNCHAKVMTESAKLEPLRESFRTGRSVEWGMDWPARM